MSRHTYLFTIYMIIKHILIKYIDKIYFINIHKNKYILPKVNYSLYIYIVL